MSWKERIEDHNKAEAAIKIEAEKQKGVEKQHLLEVAQELQIPKYLSEIRDEIFGYGSIIGNFDYVSEIDNAWWFFKTYSELNKEELKLFNWARPGYAKPIMDGFPRFPDEKPINLLSFSTMIIANYPVFDPSRSGIRYDYDSATLLNRFRPDKYPWSEPATISTNAKILLSVVLTQREQNKYVAGIP